MTLGLKNYFDWFLWTVQFMAVIEIVINIKAKLVKTTENRVSMSYGTSNAVWWYLHELTSRVVAQTGKPSDRYHLGKIILQCFKDVPNMIMQIDGATGEEETFRSAQQRSIRCASALTNLGLKQNDVIVLMAPNHLDLTIPIYAAFFMGVSVAGFDMNLGVHELRDMMQFVVPKAVFCENSNVKNVVEALQLLNISAHVITFGEAEDQLTFEKFMNQYGDNISVDDYKPVDFDPKTTNALLVSTSGSTGTPKSTALTHENVIIAFPCLMYSRIKFPTPFDIGLVISPIQWITAMFQIVLSPIVKYTRVQSSTTSTPAHVAFLFKKYKPHFTIMSPPFLISLLKSDAQCDFSSLQFFGVAGSAISKEFYKEIKKVVPNAYVQNGYGMSEISGIFSDPMYSPPGSVGMPLNHLQWKIVNPDTNDVISEPNVTGELLLKGPSVTKGYYNNPLMNAVAFDKDGWFKSGDLVYRDGNYNFYFVDRLKLLLKYNNHQVSPVEIETVILKHPRVLNAAVTGVPDPVCGDLPVAIVVPRDNGIVTAQEIKDLVNNSLSDTKQLRGGVIFVKEIPTTSTSKIDRSQLKKLAMTLKRD